MEFPNFHGACNNDERLLISVEVRIRFVNLYFGVFYEWLQLLESKSFKKWFLDQRLNNLPVRVVFKSVLHDRVPVSIRL